jgi:F-type H+-transporting ATPase subunit epsilon
MIYFELVTLEGIKFSDNVYELLLPTPDGQIGVFKNHAPIVTLATAGVIGVRHQENHADDMIEYFSTNGGVIEISDDTVRMLVDEAADSDELDEAEIKKALERAKQLRAEAKDQVSLEKAQQQIQQSSVQLKVAELKKKSRRPRSNNSR